MANKESHEILVDGMGSLQDLISRCTDQRTKRLVLEQVQELTKMINELDYDWAMPGDSQRSPSPQRRQPSPSRQRRTRK